MESNKSFFPGQSFARRSIILSIIVAAIVGTVTWVFTSQHASAQQVPTRIAVIDVQKVLTQSTPGKAATTKLKQLQDDRMTKARAMDGELRKLTTELSGAGITPARRAQLDQQIAERRLSMKRFAEDAEKEIGSARERELMALETRIKPIVDAVGKEMGLAAIFNKFESGLVFVNDSLDVTNTVITRFNGTAAAAPARP